MKTHPRIRQLAWAIAFVSASVATTARADIYTWVDSSGNVNLSNVAPPEGTRITNVFREDPDVRASAEAARASAEAARAANERDELRALNERVKQLERDLDAAKRPAPAPVVYAPAMAAPAAYPSVVTQAIVAPAAPSYADCSYPWASCSSPGYFGFYPGSVVVLQAPKPHRLRPGHRTQRVPVPAHRLPSSSVQNLPPPVGLLPAPVNLFPGTNRR